MTELSQDELKLIRAHPLSKSLETFRTTFRSRFVKRENANVREVIDKLTTEASDKEATDIILDLILVLQSQPAARNIHSRTENGPLSGDIAIFYARLSSNQEHTKQVAPLLQLIVTPKSSITQTSDIDIWTAVLDLVAPTNRILQSTTPPPSRPSFTPSFQQTPWSFNTGSFADTSEHRNQVDGVLKEELLPGLRLDIPDFVPAVFGQVARLDELAEEVFNIFQDGGKPLYKQGSGWTQWPPSAKEELVLEWLQDLTKRLLVWVDDRGSHSTTCRQVYQGPTVYLDGSPVKRKMDVGITACHGQSKGEDYGVEETPNTPISDWAEILVTGELKSNAVQDGQTPAWLDLATYAREVFRAQDRRFVLGFTLCGSMMRLWQFDRSGSSGSSSFDINEDGFRFVHIMLGYCLLNDQQLGHDPTIQQSDGKRYMEISRNDRIERLFLTEEIRKQAVVAGRATTCWRAYYDGVDSKELLVVKDSWQFEERPEEGELIKEATNKGVRNIARYYHHETVQVDKRNDDIIGSVRRGLMKACGRTTFRQKSFNKPEVPMSESPEKTVASRSNSRKRSSESTQMALPSTKRSCSSLRPIKLENSFRNRVHRRVITRDPGRPIYETSSPVAVVKGFIGAISGTSAGIRINGILLTCLGHESLFNAGILHRDVSIGNILLTEKEDDGFLIDLDLAIKTNDDQASGALSKTGTKMFMAIGALYGEPHSFMHDLESFFWVFFWICIHCDGLDEKGQVKRRRLPQYEKWNYEDTEELADSKGGLVVEEERFNKATAGFTDTFQSLASYVRDLRHYVFPNGKRWLGENKDLYSQMKSVLEKARKDLDL